jgi:inorganic triphosphatase YgiF
MDDPGAREIELKLQIAPGDALRLRRHPRVRALSLARASQRRVESVYFDTPDLDLAREGLVLRLRRVGRTQVQTLKTREGGRAGLFQRGEWEANVAGPAPDTSRIPDAALRARVEAAVLGKTLAPVFQTLVQRSSRRIGTPDWEARLDLDVGEAKTPRGSLPICELELELVRGDPGALYDLALELHDSLALRPVALGKAEASLATLLGERPQPRRARRPELARDASVDEALATIVADCLEQITANETPACDSRDPEGVHQLRVGVRRLRSALSLFRDVVPQATRERFRDELRWLGGECGEARDLDVFATGTLEPILAQLPGDADLARLAEVAADLRGGAYARARAALSSPRYSRLVLELGAWCAGRRWRQQELTPESARLFAPAREHGRTLLARRYRKVRRLGRNLGEASIEELHALRIELKKLRYASDSLVGLYSARSGDRFARRLGRLQDALGHLNDQSTADALLDRILAQLGADAGVRHARAAGFVAGWTSHAAVDGLRPLAKEWKRFARLEPFWREDDG